jgi:hypothetical protein
MAMIENETVTRPGRCAVHGEVRAQRQLPKLGFPFLVTGLARVLAAGRRYRCPECGGRTSAAGA